MPFTVTDDAGVAHHHIDDGVLEVRFTCQTAAEIA
jgi:hypothetical protein